MKAYFNQLPNLLRKDLARFYLLSGDEPLQRMEATDMIREAAYQAGYCNRELFFVDRGFNWDSLQASLSNVSLFGDKRFIDIRITAKVESAGNEFFKTVLADDDPDCFYLVQADKIDGRSAWAKRFTKQGVSIQVYSKTLQEMKAWLRERAQRKGLTFDAGIIELIADYSEGNMLAAEQELDKIALALGEESKKVTLDQAQKIIADSANYTAWNLAEAVVAGESDRALHILHNLQAEGAPMPLILWAIADQFRQMENMAQRLQNGDSREAVLQPAWRNRKAVYQKALERGLSPDNWNRLLYACYHTDRASKGQGVEKDWNELLRLVMRALRLKPLNHPLMA